MPDVLEWFKEKLRNGKDPCPRCGKPLTVMWSEDFLNDSIIIRHTCSYCGVMFNPDGTTSRLVSVVEAKAQLEIWEAKKRIVDEEAEAAVAEAEAILKQDTQ